METASRLMLVACIVLGCGKDGVHKPVVAGPPVAIGEFEITDSGGKDVMVVSLVDANHLPVAFRGVAEVVVMQGGLERCRSRVEVAYEGLRPGGPFSTEVESGLQCKPPTEGAVVATLELTLADGQKFRATDGYAELLSDRLAQYVATRPDAGAPAVAVDRTAVTDHEVAKTIIDQYVASVGPIVAAVDAAGDGVHACPAELRSAVKDPLSPRVMRVDRDALAALKGGPPADPAFAWLSPTEHALRKHLDGDAAQNVLEIATFLKQRPPYLLVVRARARRMPALVREEEHGTGAFEAGRFEGTVVLVDAASGAVKCSAPLSATSSERLSYEKGDRSALDTDFVQRFGEAENAARKAMTDPLAD